ncbi:MAG: hypothetical protein GYA23_07115 [Methanomicrobiales archaeon]|nr:hypothetical protein [Methanomicrobiales archaeon]
MKITTILATGLMVIGLLCMTGIVAAEDSITPSETPVPDGTPVIVEPEDIPPYDGPIGADSPLYGLKVAWEDLDESFTTNESEKVEKQMNHARIRLSEVRRELEMNRTDSADQALELYWQKVNMTRMTLAYYGANQTGLVHAQEMHERHQLVLSDLMLSHPNNTGLARAYNNSLQLEAKFEEKTQYRFEKTLAKNNQTIIRAYRIGGLDGNWTQNGKDSGNMETKQTRNDDKGNPHDTMTVAPQQTNARENGNQNANNDNNGNSPQENKDNGKSLPGPSVTASPQQTVPVQEPGPAGQDTPGNGPDTGKGNGNSDKGNGNGKK